nr:four helix bundle protein [Allomuricauda sp.]|tara:strand:- start:130 stop:495 length:366 start_codon:yes stop_codon:yes gene_type:complete
MATVDKFEDLEVWQLARVVCQQVEKLFQNTKLVRHFSLRDQMERSSGSIMDNIAEGFGRDGNREFHNFLSYSKGSCSELKSQTYRAFDKGLISAEDLEQIQSRIEITTNKIGAFHVLFEKI